MKFTKDLFKIYLLTVIIPTLLATTLLSAYQYDNLSNQNQHTAREDANIIVNTIEKFATELMGNMNLLASLIDEDNPEQIQDFLVKLAEEHTIATEFYFANTDGHITMSSIDLTDVEATGIYARTYFIRVLTTGGPAIYYIPASVLNPRTDLIVVATPVEINNEIIGVLIANIPPISLIEHNPSLESRFQYRIFDEEHQLPILDTTTENGTAVGYVERSISHELADWTIQAAIRPVSFSELLHSVLTSLIICVVIFHVFYYFITRNFFKKRKAALEQKRHAASRLELIGRMAGNFAHEIRNPLTGIMGFVSLLKEKHQSEEDTMYFSVIETELHRINNIVEEFLVLGKPIVSNKKYHDIGIILNEIFPIIEAKANEVGVVAKVHIGENSSPLFCNNDHMKQLILNLAINAIQASKPQDVVTVSAESKEEQITLTISDQGSGIPHSLIKDLYEPFMTTKKEGTGLGLVICKHIVDLYYGTIDVKSAIGEGTTFTITLPIKHK